MGKSRPQLNNSWAVKMHQARSSSQYHFEDKLTVTKTWGIKTRRVNICPPLLIPKIHHKPMWSRGNLCFCTQIPTLWRCDVLPAHPKIATKNQTRWFQTMPQLICSLQAAIVELDMSQKLMCSREFKSTSAQRHRWELRFSMRTLDELYENFK